MTKDKAIVAKPKIKKNAPAPLKEQIRVMEQKKRAKAAPVKTVPLKVSFDSWFHIRKASIPAIHVKEVIWAFFKSRGLSLKESVEKYDEELSRYGVSI